MKRVVFFMLTLAVTTITIAQDKIVQDLIDEYVQTLPENAEVAIGWIKNGETITQGYRKKEGHIHPVENSLSIFELGSITKTYTATLLLDQVVKGDIELDDFISRYFKASDFIENSSFDKVTFRQILTHTSGLEPSPSILILPFLKAKLISKGNPYKFITWAHYRKYLQKQELAYQPGEKWVYNNAAFGLLGQLLAQKENTTWEALVQQEIFDELGMKNSYPTGTNIPDKYFVQGYNQKGKAAPYWDMDFINPAGSIKSCVNDQLLWLNAHLEAVEGSVFQKMKTHYDIPAGWKGSVMGNAWGHRINPDSHIIWHGGASGAFRAYCSFDDQAKTAVVILVNFSNHHPNMKRDGKSLIRTYGYQIQEALKE